MHSIEYLCLPIRVLSRVQQSATAGVFGFLCKRNFLSTLIYQKEKIKMAFPTNANQVQAFAGALYGQQIGSITLAQVTSDIQAAGGLSKALNGYYSASFGSTPTATVAATVAANLGLTGTAATDAAAYITAVLNGTAASARGEAIQGVLSLFSTLTSNATFGAAATAWNVKVDAAAAYTGTTNVAIGTVISTPFSLSLSIDNIIGGAGDDTIIGDFGTTGQVSGADQINGGAGNDTVTFYGTPATFPVMSNIETLQIANAANANIDSTAISGGFTRLNILDATALSAKTITTGAGVTTSLATLNGVGTTGAVTVAASATDTTENLVLNGYQGATGATPLALTTTGAATTTVNIASTGAANAITTLTLPATATKLNITGDKNLTVSTSLAGTVLATVDASTATGNISLRVDGTAAALKFTGGSGADVITFDATNLFTTADTVDGGAGNDVLGTTKAAVVNLTTALTNVTNIETLRILDATADLDFIDLALVSSAIKNIDFGSAASAVASTATTTVRGISDGATLGLSATGTTALTIANNTANDTLNLKIMTGTSQTYTVSAGQFENLVVNVGTATTGITTGGTLALTNAQLKTVVLNSVNDANFNLGTLGTVVSSVDASNFKPATATNGVTVTLSSSAVNGATVTGSQGADTIVGSSQGDTISGGAGADTITTGGGADTVTLGAGLDTVVTTGITTAIAISDFVGGSTSSSRDLLKLDISDIEAITGVGNLSNGNSGDITAAASVVKAVSAATTLGATDSVIVLTGETYASATALKTAISSGGSRAITLATANSANDAQVFVYSDGTNAHVVTVKDAGTATSYTSTNLTVTEIATLTGIASLSATSFANGNFEFIA
jgi:hypothetical protein